MLIGKLSNGDRLMIPVTDAGEPSRVFVAADDPIAKRIVIRTAGAGERVCVHTRDRRAGPAYECRRSVWSARHGPRRELP